ncbi:MAG: hypothetical protein GYA22_01520 [Bacteroidales bacterium]|nr:hypothetical protein [Bacteroidales bacterium]
MYAFIHRLLMRFLALVIALSFSLISVYGQGEIDTQKKIFYRDESSLGILLNSNGFGLSYRYGWWLDARNKKLWEGDFVTLKHPKEVRYPFLYPNARSFIYGKLNTVFNFRVMRGHQFEMYRKVDKGGISVKYYYGAGLSAAVYKPIYYDIYIMPVGDYYRIESRKFDPSYHPAQYAGRSSFFKGFNELKALPGLSGRFGVSFDYSTVDAALHALEAGIVLDIFPKKIPIMATKQNNQIFLTLFVSYRFGKIIDRLKGKEWESPSDSSQPADGKE